MKGLAPSLWMLLLFSTDSNAQSIRILETLGGDYGYAIGVNNNGQVVGISTVAPPVADRLDIQPTLWDGNNVIALDKLDATNGFAYSINEKGQAVGTLTGRWDSYPVRWDNGVATRLSASGTAGSINDSGQVVGLTQYGATVWNGNTPTYIDPYGTPMGINESGQIAGFSQFYNTHAVKWDGTVRTDLGTLGGPYSFATDINDAGLVVGYSALNDSTAMDRPLHAVLWKDSSAIDLGTLGGPFSFATAINATGQIVGHSSYGNSLGSVAVMWFDGEMIDLNYYMDPSVGLAGWRLQAAYGISDNGWVVGMATNTKLNIARGYILSINGPVVPEPQTYAMLLAGLALLGFVSRKPHLTKAPDGF